VIITKQLQGTGIKLYGTGANASNLYVEPAGEAAEGVVMGSSIAVPGAQLPAGPLKTLVDDFATPWQAANKGVYPPQFAFDGVTGIQLLKAAIEKAGSTDREAIRDALETLDVLTPTGRFTYTKTNHSGLTAEILRMLVLYDPATGLFYWRSSSGWGSCGRREGERAGNKRQGGRIRIQLPGYKLGFLASRLAWLYMTGEWPERQVDHKNKNKRDDRWENLREANNNQNQYNRGKRSHSKTGITGVMYDEKSGLWFAECTANGRYVLRKRFKTESEAIAARNAAVKKYHGEFAVLQ